MPLWACSFFSKCVLAVIGGYFAPNVAPVANAFPADYSNTRAIGMTVYTDYVYPFEISAIILLVAIIAAIALTHRSRRESKYQDPSAQVRVHRGDRLKILQMQSEKPEVPDAVEPPPKA